MTDLTIISMSYFPLGSLNRFDDLMVQVQPYLDRLAKLTIINRGHDVINAQIGRFIEFFGENLPFLRSITLKNFSINPQIISNVLSNIEEIYLNDMQIFNHSDFKVSLSRFTKLQVFVYMNCDSNHIRIGAVADSLFERFPNLRGFGCSIEQVAPQFSNRGVGEHFKFLEKFKHLTEIYISGPVNFRGSCDIQNAVKFVPNIKRLSLCQMHLIPQLPAVIRRIATSIKEVIESRRNDSAFRSNNRVHVIANRMECQEFRAIKDFDHFIRLEEVSSPNDILSNYYELSPNQDHFRHSNSPLFAAVIHNLHR